MIKIYAMLTKPGIILGNLITTAAGFALASQGGFQWEKFLILAFGLAAVIGSACVFNNCIDRVADQKMERTKHRALAKGRVCVRNAILFAVFLGIAGFLILTFYVNVLTALIALLGFFVYVALYSVWKYRSVNGTLIGSVSGAVPPVAGYCAVSNHLDLGAFLLFLILVLWQMPHFYAIALYREKEYAAASIPVLPLVKGVFTTKFQILLYIIAFTVSLLFLTLAGYTGYIYLTASLLLGMIWIWLGIKGFRADDDRLWAKGIFRFSLVVITLLSAIIMLDS